MTEEEAIKIITDECKHIKHHLTEKGKAEDFYIELGNMVIAFSMAIRALKQTRWIPVTEELPKTNIHGRDEVWKHKVLIKGYLSFDDKKELFITTAFIEDVRNKCVPNTTVIAWMPFPPL